jgi:hypothetical protein
MHWTLTNSPFNIMPHQGLSLTDTSFSTIPVQEAAESQLLAESCRERLRLWTESQEIQHLVQENQYETLPGALAARHRDLIEIQTTGEGIPGTEQYVVNVKELNLVGHNKPILAIHHRARMVVTENPEQEGQFQDAQVDHLFYGSVAEAVNNRTEGLCGPSSRVPNILIPGRWRDMGGEATLRWPRRPYRASCSVVPFRRHIHNIVFQTEHINFFDVGSRLPLF